MGGLRCCVSRGLVHVVLALGLMQAHRAVSVDVSISARGDPVTDRMERFPCNIPRVRASELSMAEFSAEVWNKRAIIVVGGLDENARFRSDTEPEALARRFGNKTVHLGTANSYTGRVGRDTSLREYINYTMTPQPADRSGAETWYLFGDTPEPFWDELLQSYRPPKCSATYPDGRCE